MAVTITASPAARLSLNRSLGATEVPSAGAHVTNHNEYDISLSLSSSSTPPITKSYVNTLTGDQTGFDLTSMTDPELGAVDGTDLEVQVLLVNNLSGTETLTISDNAANFYSLNGTNDIVIQPGGSKWCFFKDGLVNIDATHKLIDFAITAGHSFQLGILMG